MITSKRGRGNISSVEQTVDPTRQEQRNVFYVDVGDMSTEQLEKLLKDVSEEIKGRRLSIGLDEAHELRRCAADPVYFMTTYCKFQHPIKADQLFSFTDRAYLEQLITMALEHGKVVVKHPRQAGVTTTMVAYMLWLAMFKNDQSILAGAVTRHQALDMKQRMGYMYEQLPSWLRSETRYSRQDLMKFENGSVVCFASSTKNIGRGLSLSFCYLDDFAFVKPEIQHEVLLSLLPCLSSTDGGMVVSSVPNTDTDDFFALWSSAEAGDHPAFKALNVSYFELPCASRGHWAAMEAALGVDRMRREYGGEFMCEVKSLLQFVSDNTKVLGK